MQDLVEPEAEAVEAGTVTRSWTQCDVEGNFVGNLPTVRVASLASWLSILQCQVAEAEAICGNLQWCMCSGIRTTRRQSSCALTSWRGPDHTWRFMGSYKWGYKSPNMGYNYNYPT